MNSSVDASEAPVEAITGRKRIAESFDYTDFQDAAFESRGLRKFMQYRDLGLRKAIENHGEYMVKSGDAMTIPHGLKHEVTGFSADFAVFELNIPADYDTIACDPPAPRKP